MGVTMKYYKCVHCNRIAKEKRVLDGLELGVPLYNCRNCGQPNYDKDILEAALLSPNTFLKAERKNYNTGILLSIFPFGLFAFFVVSMLMNGFHWGAILVGIPLALLVAFLLKKRSKVSADGYDDQIHQSMLRLEQNAEYANVVIHIQKIEDDSAWHKKYANSTGSRITQKD